MTADPGGSDAGDDLVSYRLRVREWLQSVTIPQTPSDAEERFEVLRDWQRALHEAGWLGVSWDPASGGQGLTDSHRLIVSEEMARASAPQPVGIIGLEVVGGSIERFGTDAQRARFLPPLLSGDDIWCQGFSEPEAGSDLASLRTRATIDGDDFVISGQKVWTSFAHKAQWCAVLARTDPDAPKHRGISYIAVDMTSPGITVSPLVQMTGDADFCEVFFDDVRVPRENLIGELNQGWPIALNTLANERGSYTLRSSVELNVAMSGAAQTLAQSGEPVSPESERELGEAFILAAALEAVAGVTAERLNTGDVPSPYDSVDKLAITQAEQAVYSAIAGVVGPVRVADDVSHGGFDTAAVVYQHYFSRPASIYGGTSQIQKNVIAERLLGVVGHDVVVTNRG